MTSSRSALARALAVVGVLAATAACSSPATTTTTGASPTAEVTTPESPASSAGEGGDAALAPVFARDADGAVIGVSYPGEDGRTALELLLEVDPDAQVTGEGETAFVTAIGGRVADPAANEFWSLSVDGEFAQVGAGVLETHDGETVTWTLDTF